MKEPETIVIGAGAAGLAAARGLSDAGRTVAVLEARPRIGGRILTVHDREWPLPVELGAEFLHGEATATREIARRAGLAVIELADEHVWVERGRIRPMGEVWSQLGEALGRIDTRATDVSLDQFLARHKVRGSARAMARLFVEGYYAAHPDRVSAHSLASGAEDADDPPRQYRMADGYFGIVEWLRAGLDPERARVHLGCAVEEVRWRRGRVAVTYRSAGGERPRALEARRAVITLPIGVLKAPEGVPGAVRFEPMPRALREAVGRLEGSQVCKVVLRFREPFWDDPEFFRRRARQKRAVEPTRIDFLHDSEGDFPTWWAARPWQAPMMTAWAGGPRADALADLPEAALLERAVSGLGRVLDVPRARVEEQLESWRTHDWRRDPWSRGAYSYVGVGGLPAQRALSRPIDGTLYFAGEATEPDEMGTVAGALASGQRAARLILKTAGRSR